MAVPPPTSWRLCARSSGISSAQTPDELMDIGNLAPSSLLQVSKPLKPAKFVFKIWVHLLGPVDDADGVLRLHLVITEQVQHLWTS